MQLTLRAADGAHLLGGADGARAHADTEGVDTRLTQVLGLLLAHNIATDNLELGVLRLDVLDL